MLCYFNSLSQTFKAINNRTYKIGDTIVVGDANNCEEFFSDYPTKAFCSVKYNNIQSNKIYRLPSKINNLSLVIKRIKEDAGITTTYNNGSNTEYIFKKSSDWREKYYFECFNKDYAKSVFYVDINEAINNNELKISTISNTQDVKEFSMSDAFYFYCKLSKMPIKILSKEYLQKIDGISYNNSSFVNEDRLKDAGDLITQKIDEINLNQVYCFRTIITSKLYDPSSESYNLDYNNIVSCNYAGNQNFGQSLDINNLLISGIKFKIINQDLFFNNKLNVSIENAKKFDSNLSKGNNGVDIFASINFKIIDDENDFDKSVIKIKIIDIDCFDSKTYKYNFLGKIK